MIINLLINMMTDVLFRQFQRYDFENIVKVSNIFMGSEISYIFSTRIVPMISNDSERLNLALTIGTRIM